MSERRYVCNLCGKYHFDLDAFLNCVSSCGEKMKKEIEEEKNKKRMEEINAALNGVQQAKKYYEDKLNEFKEKYPEEYKMNIGNYYTCSSCCKCDEEKEETETYTNEDIPDWLNVLEASYKSNGKDEPKVSMRLNGKEVQNPLEKLLSDPSTKHIAELLGL